MWSRLLLIPTGLLVVVGSSVASAEEPVDLRLDRTVRDRCLTILRGGLASDEFWPAMHAAEALTYAGRGEEVIAALAKRTALDDQQQCGLAREAVRAGDRSQ